MVERKFAAPSCNRFAQILCLLSYHTEYTHGRSFLLHVLYLGLAFASPRMYAST